MKAPSRLLADATTHPRVRADLARVKSASYAYDQAAGLAALQTSLRSLDAATAGGQALGSGATTASTVSTAGTSAATLWAAKALVITALGVGTWTAWIASEPSASRHLEMPRPGAAESTHESPQPAHTNREPAQLDVASQSPALQPAIAETPARAHKVRPQAASVRREIDQLRQIKLRMATDPGAAYRLARRSAREFPSGVLREEREGLSILALWQIGRHADARADAEQFVARYPQSPLRARIEQLLSAPQ